MDNSSLTPVMTLVLIFLLATGGIAWAGTAAYKLVMSEDKALCTSMLKLFNEDMKKYGEIRYEEHPEFVRWESIDVTQDRPSYANDCRQVLKSVFDINNDGTNDLVLRARHCLQDVLIDSLYIFPADSPAVELITNPDAQVLASTKNTINFSADVYYLRKGPKTKKGQLAAAIGGVTLQPFRRGQAFYISMTDLPQEWIVIAKYLHEEELEDICYFHGKSR